MIVEAKEVHEAAMAARVHEVVRVHVAARVHAAGVVVMVVREVMVGVRPEASLVMTVVEEVEMGVTVMMVRKTVAEAHLVAS